LAGIDDRVSDVKAKLSELTSEPSTATAIAPENLILTEIRHYRVLQVFADHQRVKVAFSSRPVHAYEVVSSAEDGSLKSLTAETDQQIKRILTSAKNATSTSGTSSNGSTSNSLKLPGTGDSGTSGSGPSHSRQSSYSSCTSMQTSFNESSYSSGSFGDSLIVVVHRKIIRQETYFLASQKASPILFGMPLVVPYYEGMTHLDLYKRVWSLVARLVSPLPPSEGPTISNHAYDWYVQETKSAIIVFITDYVYIDS